MDIFFLLLIPCFFTTFSPITSAAYNIRTLHKGSSLQVEKNTDVLISQNGVFSAGFYPVGDNAFCFAIWFTKAKTVVWMANRDQPVNGKASKLSLRKDGNLVLLDAGRIILWSTNTFSISRTHLKLLDSGNLVLRTTKKNSTLWKSFDSPTNTLLPGQKLTGELSLISYKSKTNFSSGFYKLNFDTDNVLRLFYHGDTRSSAYWPSPWHVSWEDGWFMYNSSKIAVLDGHGRFQSSDQFKFKSNDLGLNVWRRLVVDYDGNIRLYSLLKNGDWFVSWQAIQEPCSIHGICGANSLCTYNSGLRKTCSCLPGYRMISPTDWLNGCELIPTDSSDSHGDQDQPYSFVRISHADFYGYDYGYYRNSTMKECMSSCLNSSFCKGFQYKFQEEDKIYWCFPKVELLNGYRSPSFRGDIYIKLPKSSSQFLSQNQPTENNKLDCSDAIHTQQLNRTYEKSEENGSVKLLLWCACVLGGVEFMLIFLAWCFLSKTRTRTHMKGCNLAPTGFRQFTYAELKKATKGFKEEIGRGSGGIVYKGVLDDRDKAAAIKRLNKDNGGEVGFLAEVSSLGRLNHMNLIDMWGYCAEGNHRLLVYEYMELGSLAENLCFSSKTLDSEKRFDIAVGTAKGLAYLHEECLEWVLHCDVKPQNILLDLDYQPKVADFGLSKLLNRSGVNNSSFSRMRGTRGYMAPEWVFSLQITSKVDVYSFGIVVLEMVTGKKPAQENLVTWVKEKMKPSESWIMDEIMDPGFKGVYARNKMQLLVSVALLCVEEDKDARPTMSEVVEMLQDKLLLDGFNS